MKKTVKISTVAAHLSLLMAVETSCPLETFSTCNENSQQGKKQVCQTKLWTWREWERQEIQKKKSFFEAGSRLPSWWDWFWSVWGWSRGSEEEREEEEEEGWLWAHRSSPAERGAPPASSSDSPVCSSAGRPGNVPRLEWTDDWAWRSRTEYWLTGTELFLWISFLKTI